MERPLWKTPIERRPDAARLRGARLFLCLLLSVFPAHAVKFTTSIDRDSIVVGESVNLTFTFEGSAPGGTPQIPVIPGLQIAGGMSSGYNSSLGPDGRMQTVQTYSVPLIANQAGEIQIPAFHIEIAGQKLSSQPLKLKVLQEDPTAPPAELSTRSAFLWFVAPRKEFYLGESIVVELRLYLRAGVRNIDGYQPPALAGEGFTSSPWKQGQNFQRRVGGQVFTILPVLSTITAAKTGPIRIAPMNASVVLNPDVFEGFWGRRSNSERVALALGEQTLQVLPLPTENQPAGFNGAVGQYTMTVNVGPTNVATGDPITVKVQIAGRGNLSGLMLPEQTAWQDFKAYPPTANFETSDPWGLQGAKTFEQIIVPQNTDIKELAPLTFSYFDPETKLYRTLAQPAVPLTIRPGGSTPAPVIATTQRSSDGTPPPQQDIVPIKTRLGKVTRPDSASGQRKLFLALNALPALAFIGAIVWRKRTNALANNPRLRRQRKVDAAIGAGVKRLHALASQNKSDEFFAELVHLLQEKLGERLDCPALSITEAVIDEKLRPRGVPDTTLEELHALFQSCNLARYAPIKSSEELASIIPRVEATLKKLEEVKP